MRPGLTAKATHDHKRDGTRTLFAALEVAIGQVTDAATTGMYKPNSWTS